MFAHSLDFNNSEEEIQSVLRGTSYEARSEVLEFNGQQIHYMEIGDEEKPVVMLVHGSPGIWDNFLNYFGDVRLLEHARIIAVTRPGYGLSGKGTYEPSVQKQAAAFLRILKLRSPAQPAVLLGHSYGGPVVARMAMDGPQFVSSLVLAAASIDPELEKMKWFQYPAAVPPISWLVPSDLLVCNREILALKPELEAMMPLWERISHPVTVIHGDRDDLVPVGNAEFAERMLINANVRMRRYPDMNHFVIWTHQELVTNILLDLVRDIK